MTWRDDLRRARAPLLASLAVLAATTLATPAIWRAGRPHTDVGLYATYGGETVRGAVPYRDFFIEYPPGALAAIVPPALPRQSVRIYGYLFATEMLALVAATLAVVAVELAALGTPSRRAMLGLLPLAASPLLLGPLPANRYDALPAFLAAFGLVLAMRGRGCAGAAALGIGAAAKLYPAALLPAILVLSYRRNGRRACLRAAGTFAGVVALVVVPFAIVAPHGLYESFRYQLARPLQFETLGGSLALLAHSITGFGVGLVSGNGSFNIGGARGTAIGLAQTLVLIGVVLWILKRTSRAAATPAGAALAGVAMVAALVAFGRILSDQYLVWLLPLVPFVPGNAGLVSLGLVGAAEIATRVWYYGVYTVSIHTAPMALLAARNLLLVALLVVLCRTLRRPAATGPRTRTPRSSSPA